MKYKIEIIASMSGWMISLLIHLGALFSAVGIVVLISEDQPVERKVGIYVDQLDKEIKTSSDKLPSFVEESKLVDLVEVAADPTLRVAPIAASLGSESSSSAIKPDLNTQTILIDNNLNWDGVNLQQGKAAATSFFGISAVGEKFVFVIDKSGSMNDSQKLEIAKEEVRKSISRLNPWQEFYIIFYDKDFSPMPSEDLVTAEPQNLKKFFGWMKSITPGGGTDPTLALRIALALHPDAIYLLSDGIFPESVPDAIRPGNPDSRTKIHTIAYYSDEGDELLQTISSQNDGKHIYIPPPEK